MKKILFLVTLLFVGCSAQAPSPPPPSPSPSTSIQTERNSQKAIIKKDESYYKMAPGASPPKVAAPAPAAPESTTIPKKIVKSPNFNAKVADAIINQLTVASMVFGLSTHSANVDEKIKAQLIIDPSKTPKELVSKLTLPENVTTTQTRITISKIVSAKIVAPDFTVVPITPEKQGVAATEPTEWVWELIPTHSGKFNVHLSISAVVTIDGNSTERFIKTFDENVEVIITPKQIAQNWFSKYWQWLFSALVIPLGVFVWKNRKGKE